MALGRREREISWYKVESRISESLRVDFEDKRELTEGKDSEIKGEFLFVVYRHGLYT